MQMTTLKERLTPAQQRRRQERIARRARSWMPVDATPRVRFIDRLRGIGKRLAFFGANREKAAALAMQIARNFEQLRLRSAVADRCSYRREYVVKVAGRAVKQFGDPCGGRLKAHKRVGDWTSKELQCETCGRVYVDARTEAA
jgi:hypothetical protein